jgi:Uma2 family endonuclease
MTSHPHRVKFTYEDYLLFPEDGRRHELIDGEHYVTPAPRTKHQAVVSNLLRTLATCVRDRRLGRVFAAPTDVVLSDLDVVQPDLLFISTARLSIMSDRCIQGPPDLVVEILSESTRKTDEIIKRKLYERFAVREYWIVDPELETVKVFALTDRGYIRSPELSREAGESLTTSLLPDFRIPLAEIFE